MPLIVYLVMFFLLIASGGAIYFKYFKKDKYNKKM